MKISKHARAGTETNCMSILKSVNETIEGEANPAARIKVLRQKIAEVFAATEDRSERVRLIKDFDAEIEKLKKIQEIKPVNGLSDKQKTALINNFKEWSGGFTPDECPWEGDDEEEMSVSQYIEHTLPTDLPAAAAVKFLRSLTE